MLSITEVYAGSAISQHKVGDTTIVTTKEQSDLLRVNITSPFVDIYQIAPLEYLLKSRLIPAYTITIKFIINDVIHDSIQLFPRSEQQRKLQSERYSTINIYDADVKTELELDQSKTAFEWYEVFGLPANASPQQGRHAFHRLALKYHPDKNPAEIAKKVMVILGDANAKIPTGS